MAHGTFSVFALACPRTVVKHACSLARCSAVLIFDVSIVTNWAGGAVCSMCCRCCAATM